ncbi:MAG: YlbF family regulator [Lachnospiraceae bacterium]|nr:YlbF family regulator [Lachnospiraceae bacterium]
MENIKECTKALIDAILDSGEYRRFCEVRDQVREKPELRSQINEFRLHVFEVQNSKEPLDMYGEQERLCRDFEEFRKNPLVNEFLEAELRVCRIMQEISTDIAGAVDLDSADVSERIKL